MRCTVTVQGSDAPGLSLAADRTLTQHLHPKTSPAPFLGSPRSQGLPKEGLWGRLVQQQGRSCHPRVLCAEDMILSTGNTIYFH